jgi:hypothetical protein
MDCTLVVAVHLDFFRHVLAFDEDAATNLERVLQ